MSEKPKILIVEDQMLIAFELVELLETNGFHVLGPFTNVDEARLGIEYHKPDAALLDINLGRGETSEPLADLLIDLKIPFSFLSGFRSAGALAPRFKGFTLMRKPARPHQVLSMTETLVSET